MYAHTACFPGSIFQILNRYLDEKFRGCWSKMNQYFENFQVSIYNFHTMVTRYLKKITMFSKKKKKKYTLMTVSGVPRNNMKPFCRKRSE